MKLQIYILFFVIFHILHIEIFAQISTCGPSCRNRELQKWEILSQEGKYDEAIIELQNYILFGDKESKHKYYWHLGQLYAFKNDYATAVIYLKKSTKIFDLLFDKYWRYYYKGTIAFLQRKENKLHKYYLKMQKENSEYYKGNTSTLKSLYINFEKPYLDAYIDVKQ
jgi:tetratricopeptide (TPR) repeat protein